MTRGALLVGLALLAGCNGGNGGTGNGGSNGTDRKDSGDAQPVALFTEITDDVGLDFTHEPWTESYFFMPEMTAPGCALFDYDGDGDLDAYLVNSAAGPGTPAAPGARPVNRMFAQGEDGSFTDVTEASGLGHDGYGIGVAIGDVNGDGHPDVYLTNLGADALFLNDGDGTFTDVTVAWGLGNEAWACSAAFLDYDRDGDLDLYVANYVTVSAEKICADASGRQDFCGPQVFPGVGDLLYRNDGGAFTDVSGAAGLGAKRGKGLGVVCRDFDDDGWLDVYVANDGEANHLWRNRGDGTFEDVAFQSGAAVNMFGEPEASMGIAVGDVDDDGDEDLFMTHLAAETNTLYLNDGDGFFDEATARSGLGSTSTAFTGFGTYFIDFDHDRDLDIAIVNGRVKRGSAPYPGGDQGPFWNEYAEPNQLYENLGGGRFAEISAAAPAWSGPVEVSRGLACGDVDGDGDIDLLVTNCKGRARLYRNDAPKAGRWLLVNALDAGRDAYGAQVTVRAGDTATTRLVHADGSYASSSAPSAHFGLGAVERVDAIEVRWVDGTVETFDGGAVDRAVTLRRGDGEVIR